MADRVIQRNDTAARWQSINPVLATGELGIVIDGAKGYKIGDGVTPWNDLPYPASPTNIVQELGDNEDVVISQKVVTEALSDLDSKISTADEEDITSDENSLLKLKDRNNLNGMGYMILRKNKTFAEQLTQTNTIYEIRYSFDLNGEEVAIPEGCTLKFEGGSLNNGIIIGNNTLISAIDNSINCEVKGSLTNSYVSITWFGAVSSSYEEQVDCTEQILNAIQASSNTGVCVLVPSGTFYHQGLILPNGVTIKGKSINGSILRLKSENVTSNAITIVDDNCEISNITIFGNGRYHPSFGDIYEEQQGNGICICNGSRFSKENKQCTNTKIYDIIIEKCGNNGLAIIDKQKWVYNFHNVTIKNCGNVGFLDNSTDNNYVGFNISHCESVGLHIKGTRNRYVGFKVFVCGYNYKNNNDGTPTNGTYWQGVRIEGSHNSLNGFDIQECGGELLYVGSSSACNYIQSALDRPGFGIEYVKDFRPYTINGRGNRCDLSIVINSTYHQREGYALSENDIKISEGANIKYYGTNSFKNVTLTHDLIGRLTDNGGAYIDETKQSEFVGFENGYAMIKKAMQIPMSEDFDANFKKSFALRVYDTREDKNTRKDNSIYLVFEPYTTIQFNVVFVPSGIFSELRKSSKANGGSYINIPATDYVDFYVSIARDSVKAILMNQNGDCYLNELDLRDIEFTEKAVALRLGGMGCSNFHVFEGLSVVPFDVTKKFGLTFPLKSDLFSEYEYVNSGNSRPNVSSKGFQYFDTTLNKPIWWTGSNWVDATGVVV